MEYIIGKLSIINDLDNVADVDVMDNFYYGASDLIPAEIPLEAERTDFDGTEASCSITSIVPGRIEGRYCWVAYPANYGDLKHVYCVYNGVDLHIDLIGNWVKSATTTVKNHKTYYLYYQDHKTKDNKLVYKFMLK